MSNSTEPARDARLAELHGLDILDSDYEQAYDDICALASAVCGTPIALISLVDRDRQWFKAKVGLDVRETPVELAFCAHAIDQDGVFEIPDASLDNRFRDNALVTSDPHIRFYAGAPLVTARGHALGTVCVIDRQPRRLTAEQRTLLQALSRQVSQLLSLREATATAARRNQMLLAEAEAHGRMLAIVAHDLRSPLVTQAAVAELALRAAQRADLEAVQRYLGILRSSAGQAALLVENLLAWGLAGATGLLEPKPEAVDVETIVAEVRAALLAMTEGKGITVAAAGGAGITVVADRHLLRSILLNLLGNALKFSPAGQHVRIEWQPLDEGMVSIAVIDQGPGIPAAQLAAIASGALAESTVGTAGERGTGVGLRLCDELARRSGGRFHVEAGPGIGSRVSVVLPGA